LEELVLHLPRSCAIVGWFISLLNPMHILKDYGW
jgi:hypothetical protein